MPARRPWNIRVTVNLMSGDSAKEIVVFVRAHNRTRHLYDLVKKVMRPNPSEVIELVTQSAQKIVPTCGFVCEYLTNDGFLAYHECGEQLVDPTDIALDINLTAIVQPDLYFLMLVGEE